MELPEVSARKEWKMFSPNNACSSLPTFSPMAGLSIRSVLADIILTDDKKGRRLGRPWITVAVCDDTKMVAGFHVSFEIPGPVSVARCLAHAFGAKDIDGLGLANDWPCEGVAKIVRLEATAEYDSPTLRKAAAELGFTLLFEPDRRCGDAAFLRPFLDGLGIAMLGGTDALTYDARAAGGNPGAVCGMPEHEFTAALTKWIVEEQQFAPVAGLGMSPRQAWNLGVGATILPKPSASALSLLEAWRVRKRIGRSGVSVSRRIYWHGDLVNLKKTYGAEQGYIVRVNRNDLTTVVLEVPDGTSLTLRSDQPEDGAGARSRLRTDHDTTAAAVPDGDAR